MIELPNELPRTLKLQKWYQARCPMCQTINTIKPSLSMKCGVNSAFAKCDHCKKMLKFQLDIRDGNMTAFFFGD